MALPAAGAKPKNQSIESLRGLAIILMVAGHVIGSNVSRGMLVDDGSFGRIYYRALEDIRMPLFTVLSGFVYAYRPLHILSGWPRMTQGKARRLLVPMVTVSTLYFLVQFIAPDTNTSPEPSKYWRIFVFGYEHLWFVQSIFLIFLLVGVLDATGLLGRWAGWVACFLVAGAAFVLLSLPASVNFFSINGAVRLLPFFLLGYGMHVFPERFGSMGLRVVLGGAFVCLFTLRITLILADGEPQVFLNKMLSLSLGICAVTLLLIFRHKLHIKFLAWLGPFSYGIYLLHVFGSAGTRIALGRIGLENDAAIFIICMTMSIGLAVLFELLFGRFKWISWGILGQKPRKAHTSTVTPKSPAVSERSRQLDIG